MQYREPGTSTLHPQPTLNTMISASTCRDKDRKRERQRETAVMM
jgi:hypothetical protein